MTAFNELVALVENVGDYLSSDASTELSQAINAACDEQKRQEISQLEKIGEAGHNGFTKGFSNGFSNGYYCAIAQLLRYEGCMTPIIDELYRSGGDPSEADDTDKELFRQHGLIR